jgi:hypothetical protein
MNHTIKTMEWHQVELHSFQNGVVPKNTISPFVMLLILVGLLLLGYLLYTLLQDTEDKIYQTLQAKSDEPVKQ